MVGRVLLSVTMVLTIASAPVLANVCRVVCADADAHASEATPLPAHLCHDTAPTPDTTMVGAAHACGHADEGLSATSVGIELDATIPSPAVVVTPPAPDTWASSRSAGSGSPPPPPRSDQLRV